MKVKIALILGLSICLSSMLQAQNTYSPYTVFGVGDINDMDLVHNIAMGGVGYSIGTPFHLNNKNPALLTSNQVVVFETSVITEYKGLQTLEEEQESFTGGLGYLAFGFPVIRGNWTISFGLMPYSYVNYESIDPGFVSGTSRPLSTTYKGSGGVSQAYFASGLKLLKGLSLGVRVSYLFGSIEEDTEFFVLLSDYATADVSRNSFSDITLGLGLAYNLELKPNENYLNLGIVYDLGGDQSITRLQRLERRTRTGDLLSPVDEPYVISDDESGSVYFPSTLGLGFGFEKKLKWSVAADITFSNWSEYRDFNGDSDGLIDRRVYAIGGSIIPDAFDVGNYLNRVTYMAGFKYEQTPYFVNDTEIQDFGINFGVTLPLRNISRLSLAFEVGQRGTTDNSLIQERYFKAHLGLSFNDNKWFIRRKFD